MSYDDSLPNNAQQDLECLRLASDLMQLSRATLDPAMKAHCDAMAAFWSERARAATATMIDDSHNQLPGAAIPAAGPAVILIVDDDPLLRDLMAGFAADAGYVALEAADADEAVAMLEARGDIAALVTDIEMPGSMSGLGLARLAHARWPRIGILVVSGQLRPRSSDLPQESAFLSKPFRGAAMIDTLQSLIDRS